MLKKIIAGILSLALTAAPALAEVYSGVTSARSTLAVSAVSGGTIGELQVQPGSIVEKGASIARLRTTRVFASQNGTIARIQAKEGKEIEGSVLELNPVSRYTVYCTADSAYDSTNSNLLHCGETLYLYCTYNGTHQGSGRVYSIDAETYMVEATGGEFLVGETVYLYRDADYSYKQRVGIGTVVASATEVYQADGRVTKIHVSEGEYVERGELLYEIIEGESADILAPAAGIITACEAAEGSAVQDGQAVAQLAPYDEIFVTVQLEEAQAGQISIGDPAALSYACDDEEHLVPGEVVDISGLAQDGYYTVYIAPETPPAYLGMSVSVRIG